MQKGSGEKESHPLHGVDRSRLARGGGGQTGSGCKRRKIGRPLSAIRKGRVGSSGGGQGLSFQPGISKRHRGKARRKGAKNFAAESFKRARLKYKTTG